MHSLRREPGSNGLDHHDLGADLHALIEIRDVIVAHANAAGRYVGADGPRLFEPWMR